MGVVEAAGAAFPDPLVRLAPAPADRLAETVEHARRVAVEAPAAGSEPRHGVDHLAVDIELELAMRVVADPHRPRARVALQVRQLRSGSRASPKTS